MNASRWIGIGALVVSGAASAVPVIDQNQPNAASYIGGFIQTGLAQSFIQSGNNIDGAGIHLQSQVGTSDTVTIALWNLLPNQTGATMLTSGSGVATAGSDLNVFWAPVSITTGATYYLVFTGLNNTLGIAGSVSNPYPNGQTYANAGYMPYASYDYAFRTYFDNALVGAVVPEPGMLALLGLGIAGLAASRRRTGN